MRFIKTYRELIEFENLNKKFKNIIKHFLIKIYYPKN